RSPHLSSCLFAATAPAHLYTLSLHDALPISRSKDMTGASMPGRSGGLTAPATGSGTYRSAAPKSAAGRCGSMLVLASSRARCPRSEEHTSELQSRENLVCRLLLEKKKRQRH